MLYESDSDKWARFNVLLLWRDSQRIDPRYLCRRLSDFVTAFRSRSTPPEVPPFLIDPRLNRILNGKTTDDAEIRSFFGADSASVWFSVLVLGSATPSIDTYMRVMPGVRPENKLELFWDTEINPKLDRVDQSDQSDLDLLNGLVKDVGLALKVSDKKLIVFDEYKYEQADPVLTIAPPDYQVTGQEETPHINVHCGGDFTAKTRDIFWKCHVKYQDTKTKKVIEATFADTNKKAGQTLEINEQVADVAEAERLAKKRLREKNCEEFVGRYTRQGCLALLAGMVVTTSEGMAGVVDQVYRHYSRFMLISANRSRVGIRVLRKESRAVGVLTGQGPNRSLLQGEYFGRDDDVQTGDMLVTSGIGGKYPAGLFVGTVRGVEADITGLQKLVQIEPAADLSRPDRVFVILQEDVKRRIEKEIAEEAGEAKP